MKGNLCTGLSVFVHSQVIPGGVERKKQTCSETQDPPSYFTSRLKDEALVSVGEG